MLNLNDIIGDRYKIKKLLNRDTFESNYLAEDIKNEQDDNLVYIKQLENRYLVEKRFNNEINTLKILNDNPHIPKLINSFCENEQLFLIQEFIEGTSLQEIISDKVMKEKEGITLLNHLLNILFFIHNNNIIHRNITPFNILRKKRNKQIILLNFSCVKEIINQSINFDNPESQNFYTQVIGTAAYMPPEQYNSTPKFSSDIYGLGKTIIYTLTGKQPLELENLKREYDYNWDKFAIISPQLVAILNKMVESDYKKRYQSVEQVLTDLKPLIIIEETLNEEYKIEKYLKTENQQYIYLAKNIKNLSQPLCIIKSFISNDGVKIRPDIKEKFIKIRFKTELNCLETFPLSSNIPKLYQDFKINNDLYLVEELIEGKTILDRIENRQFFSNIEISSLLKDFFPVLNMIHQHGFIHRNINPSNLTIRNDKLVLTDFSLAKKILTKTNQDDSSYFRKKRQENLYYSPEQTLGQTVFASDIYSLGIVAIESIIGDNINQESLNQEYLINQLKQRGIKAKLINILMKMTKPELSQRYQKVEEIINDLDNKKSPQPVKGESENSKNGNLLSFLLPIISILLLLILI